MIVDKYGQHILSENDLCDLYMRDPDRVIKQALVKDDITLSLLDIENKPKLQKYTDPNISIKEFDERCQNTWYMPKEYIDFDIAKFVLDQCNTQPELQQIGRAHV